MMSIFRELTAEEENRRTLIMQSARSDEAMRQLEIHEIDISLGLARTAIILTENENPFPGADPIGIADILDSRTEIGTSVKAAVGHAMVLQANNQYETPEDMTTGLLSDVYAQALSAKLLKGLDDADYAATLNESAQRIVGYAKDDEDIQKQLAHEAKGEFHKIDSYAQNDLQGDFNGANLPPATKDAVSRFYGAEDYRFEQAKFTQTDMSHNTNSAVGRVSSALLSGVTTGQPEVDRALRAVKERVGADLAAADPEHESRQFDRMVSAGARYLDRQDRGEYVDAKNGAALMLNDIAIQRAAGWQLENNAGHEPHDKRNAIIARGAWHELRGDQTGLAQVADAMNDHRHANSLDIVSAQNSIIKGELAAANQREHSLAAAQLQAGMGR